MAEITYYSDSSVQISSEWVKLGGKIYPVAEIDSVSMRSAQSDSSRDLPYFLMIAGSITTFVLLNAQQIFPNDWEVLVPRMLVVGLVLAVVGIAVLVVQSLLKKDYIYGVKLSGTFGDAIPFASDDPRYVQKIISAIEIAIMSQVQNLPVSAPIAADA